MVIFLGYDHWSYYFLIFPFCLWILGMNFSRFSLLSIVQKIEICPLCILVLLHFFCYFLSFLFSRVDDLFLEFRINRCKIKLVENQTQLDASSRSRLMTVKDYNIKENNVIAMVCIRLIRKIFSSKFYSKSNWRRFF